MKKKENNTPTCRHKKKGTENKARASIKDLKEIERIPPIIPQILDFTRSTCFDCSKSQKIYSPLSKSIPTFYSLLTPFDFRNSCRNWILKFSKYLVYNNKFFELYHYFLKRKLSINLTKA